MLTTIALILIEDWSGLVCAAFHLKEAAKKKRFFWEISPKSVYPPTHPRVFVRFGRSKGEIRVEKGDFRGDLGGF